MQELTIIQNRHQSASSWIACQGSEQSWSVSMLNGMFYLTSFLVLHTTTMKLVKQNMSLNVYHASVCIQHVVLMSNTMDKHRQPLITAIYFP